MFHCVLLVVLFDHCFFCCRVFVCDACLLVGLFVCLLACLFACSFVRLFVCLLVCLFVCLFVCLWKDVFLGLFREKWFLRIISKQFKI